MNEQTTSNPYQPPEAEEPREPVGGMTSTAWKMGGMNAAITMCVIVAVVVPVMFYVSSVTQWSRWVVIGTVFGGVWLGTAGAMIVGMTAGMQRRGTLLLDCGGLPGRKLFVLNVVMFFGMGVLQLVSNAQGLWVGIFFLSFAGHSLLMSLCRFSVHQYGLWLGTGLLPWQKIISYSWKPKNTLVFTRGRRLPLLHRGALPVPKDCVNEMRRLLEEYVGPPDNGD